MAKAMNGTPESTAKPMSGTPESAINFLLGDKPDGKKLKQVAELVGNVYSLRTEFWRQLFDPRRDYYQECGFPATRDITPEQLKDLYDREPIAARVVEVYPKECWQVSPEVYEDEDGEEATPFEAAWDRVGRMLKGERSYHKQADDGQGHPLWEYAERVDILSGIGRYGVLLLGLNDRLPDGNPAPLDREVQPIQEGEERKLLYIRALPEIHARVNRLENRKDSPRFGLPVSYQVTLNDPNNDLIPQEGTTSFTMDVHWTRIVHIADGLESSEWCGVSRMRPVLNCLLNLVKASSSGEMFWKSAYPGLSIESNPQLGSDVEYNPEELRDMVQSYQNGLDRYLALMGFQAKTLSPTFVDPTAMVNSQIDLICVKIACPVPVFKGYEIGEQASENNRLDWESRLQKRWNSYLIPRVIAPTVDRLIQVGVLPIPSLGFSIFVPPLSEKSETEKITIASQKTAAIAQYIAGQVEQLIPPFEYLTLILGMDEMEAEMILQKAAEGVEQKMAEQPAPDPDSPEGQGGEGEGTGEPEANDQTDEEMIAELLNQFPDPRSPKEVANAR